MLRKSMAKFHLIENEKESIYLFHCPGCEYGHHVRIKAADKTLPTWEVSGINIDKPTVAPSILVWASRPEVRCHSYICNGNIQYLSDCHHKLAGKTVELPDFDMGDSK
jgi:hypothetical protein